MVCMPMPAEIGDMWVPAVINFGVRSAVKILDRRKGVHLRLTCRRDLGFGQLAWATR